MVFSLSINCNLTWKLPSYTRVVFPQAGQDSYKFMPVDIIAILNFKLNKDHDKVKYEFFIKSDENALMTKNLQFTFIELPNHKTSTPRRRRGLTSSAGSR